MAKMRIDKLLSNMGYGSRREIKSDLKMGKITVNGITAKDPSSMIDTESDKVMYLDDLVEYREFVYIMMNKPQRCNISNRRQQSRNGYRPSH